MRKNNLPPTDFKRSLGLPSAQLARAAFPVFPICCQWGCCGLRNASAVPKRNKESERGGKTPLASDSSGALNSSPLWARLVLANTWKGMKRPLQSPQMLGLSFLLSGPLMLSWARLARLAVTYLVFEIAVLPRTTEMWPATHPRSSRYLEG